LPHPNLHILARAPLNIVLGEQKDAQVRSINPVLENLDELFDILLIAVSEEHATTSHTLSHRHYNKIAYDQRSKKQRIRSQSFTKRKKSIKSNQVVDQNG
jgi:hypothetical protein